MTKQTNLVPDLPAWVPQEAWAEFVKMRKQIKKPMTAYAERLMLKRLQAFADDGQDPEAMLNQSILACWQNIYPVKDEQVQQVQQMPRAPFPARPPQLSVVDQNRANSEAARRMLFAPAAERDDDFEVFDARG